MQDILDVVIMYGKGFFGMVVNRKKGYHVWRKITQNIRSRDMTIDVQILSGQVHRYQTDIESIKRRLESVESKTDRTSIFSSDVTTSLDSHGRQITMLSRDLHSSRTEISEGFSDIVGRIDALKLETRSDLSKMDQHIVQKLERDITTSESNTAHKIGREVHISKLKTDQELIDSTQSTFDVTLEAIENVKKELKKDIVDAKESVEKKISSVEGKVDALSQKVDSSFQSLLQEIQKLQPKT